MDQSDEQLDYLFYALAHPTRRAILARLAHGDATVMELARPFEMSLPAVSKHMKVLMRAGLVSRSRRAQWLRCRLEPGPLNDASRWIDEQRTIWDDTLSHSADFQTELLGQRDGISITVRATDERSEQLEHVKE